MKWIKKIGLLICVLTFFISFSPASAQELVHLKICVQGMGDVCLKQNENYQNISGSFEKDYPKGDKFELICNGKNLKIKVDEKEILSKKFSFTLDHDMQIYVQFSDKNETMENHKFSMTDFKNVKGGLNVIDFTRYIAYYGNGYHTNGIWKLNNGKFAFCAEGNFARPEKGDLTEQPVEIKNEELRKVLYYGYHGPKDCVSNRLKDESKAVVATNEMASHANTGTCNAEDLSNGYHWRNWIQPEYEYILKQETPPENFIVYGVKVLGEGLNCQNLIKEKQTLVYWDITPLQGCLKIKKKSSNPDISDGNPSYSLKNAQYGVYLDSKASKLVGTLQTNEDGWSNQLKLKEGKYYLKEIKAPLGYSLSSEIIPVYVKGNQETIVDENQIVDKPIYETIDLLIEKKDADLVDRGSMKNALFKVDFCLKDSDKIKKSWILKTDDQGHIYLKDAYKVGGDSLYKENVLPIGTLHIQEIKAPDGYSINPKIYTVNVDGDPKTIYQAPVITDQPNRIQIFKCQKGENIGISETEFLYTKPNGEKKKLKTNKDGKIELKRLMTGKHVIQEIKAKAGYMLDKKEIIFYVDQNGKLKPNPLIHNDVLKIENDVVPFSLKVLKKDDENNKLSGAEFTLYEDEQCKKNIETKVSENGELVFKNLKNRTHYYLKETKVPKGYQHPEKDIIYDIFTKSSPEKKLFEFSVNGKTFNQNTNRGNVYFEDDIENPQICIEVQNKKGIILPKTGSVKSMIFTFLGLTMMVCAIMKRE